jgi:uncharacterized membrane protein
MQDLGTLGGVWNPASDINNAGWTVGASSTGDISTHRAVAWHDGTIQQLVPDQGSQAYSINELGQIVGFRYTNQPLVFLWESGKITDFALPDLSASVFAATINDLGQIAVTVSSLAAYLMVDGAFQPLGTLGGSFSAVFGMNDVGQAVGYSYSASGPQHAVLWTVPIAPAIDVAPGDAANQLKLSAKGQLAVAILTTPYFDATRVAPGSLALGNDDGNDTPVARDRKLAPMVIRKDVDRDGDMDIVAQFDQQAMVQRGDIAASSTKLVLTGALNDGKRIRGSDKVTVIP